MFCLRLAFLQELPIHGHESPHCRCKTLCQVVPKVVYDLELVLTDVHRESINIYTNYSLLWNKFAECHQMLNGKIQFDNERVERFSK